MKRLLSNVMLFCVVAAIGILPSAVFGDTLLGQFQLKEYSSPARSGTLKLYQGNQNPYGNPYYMRLYVSPICQTGFTTIALFGGDEKGLFESYVNVSNDPQMQGYVPGAEYAYVFWAGSGWKDGSYANIIKCDYNTVDAPNVLVVVFTYPYQVGLSKGYPGEVGIVNFDIYYNYNIEWYQLKNT